VRILEHQAYKGINYFTLDLDRLANILCRIERFNAHTDFSISVGHHSIHCLYLAKEKYPNSKRIQQLALYHDISEAYYGDIPTYIKKRLGDEARYQLNLMDQEIFSRLNIDYPLKHEKDIIKEIDLTALTLEAKVGFNSLVFDKDDWPTPYTWDTYTIQTLTAYPFYALEEKLLQLFKEYQYV